MPRSGLAPLQERVLRALAGFDPEWTLVGGGALVGVYGVLRATRDLDLAFRSLESLGRIPENVGSVLDGEGLDVEVLQSGATFHRFRVSDGDDAVLLDLVAEPVSPVEPDAEHEFGGKSILVATEHEILVEKLCALIGRVELRDLTDVTALLSRGGDLARALSDAPRKDGGFSPLTLCWLLEELQIAPLARAEGRSDRDVRRIEEARRSLIEQISEACRPDA